MKIIIASLVVVLTCSCSHNGSHLARLDNTITRHDEVLNIMRDHSISNLENSKWITVAERNELRKMKKDYYYELSDPNLVLTIPGPGWEIKGPLSTTDNAWNHFIKERREGDELYFFSSDAISWAYLRGRAGYILIRNNKIVTMVVTKMN